MIGIESVRKLLFKGSVLRKNTFLVQNKQSLKKNIIIITLFIILITIFLLSFTIGQYSVPLSELIKIFVGKLFSLPVTWDETVETMLFNVRIPRILTAILIGAALATSGAVYQGLFKNPIVSPDVLGVSAGAGFGAALAILMSWNIVFIQLSAFLLGMIAVLLTYFISAIISRRSNTVLVLILTGMVVSTLFSSFVSVVKYVADPESKLPAITFWLMGSLSFIRTKDVLTLMIPFFLGIIPLFLISIRVV